MRLALPLLLIAGLAVAQEATIRADLDGNGHAESFRLVVPDNDPRADLEIAGEYTNDLQAAGAPRGIVAFCALPVRLAYAALEAVEAGGPGSKVSRDQVFAIVEAMEAALDAGTAAVPLGQPVSS